MTGKLYAVGVGPGDPELLTLKAVRVLKEVQAVAVPRGREEGESIALGIIGNKVDLKGKEIIELHFPMVKNLSPGHLKSQAEAVIKILQSGKDTAFVTLGCPTLYSTFFHLMESILKLDRTVKTEIIPGISSVNASSARAGISLALSGEKVAIVPAIYAGGLKPILKEFDSVVLMKAGSAIPAIRKALSEAGLLDNAVLVSRAGFPDEVITPLAMLNEDKLSYFSTIIVRKK